MLNNICGEQKEGIGPPEFMDLDIMHFVFDRDINHDTEYLLNHDSDGTFTRAVFYQNILYSDKNIITVENLSKANQSNDDFTHQIFQELKRIGCLDPDTKIENRVINKYKKFFPIPTIQFVSQNNEEQRKANGLFKNLILAGKSSSEGNFVHNIINSMANKLAKIDEM